MTIDIEITSGENTRNTQIDTNIKEIKDIIAKLQEKFPDWEEFAVSNHKTKQIRILVLKDTVKFLDKFLVIGNLVSYLDRSFHGWIRCAISKREFPIIENLEYSEGMLIRSAGKNTNMYNIVLGVNGNKIQVNGEGIPWIFDKIENGKYRLICKKVLNKEDFLSFDWPAYKKCK